MQDESKPRIDHHPLQTRPPQAEVPREGSFLASRCSQEKELSYVQGLRCRECKRHYEEAAIYVCDFCFGPLEVVYDYEAMQGRVTRESIAAGPLTMWRYRDLLPVRREHVVEIHNGFTPLIRA